jgi:hypothetical protein
VRNSDICVTASNRSLHVFALIATFIKIDSYARMFIGERCQSSGEKMCSDTLKASNLDPPRHGLFGRDGGNASREV